MVEGRAQDRAGARQFRDRALLREEETLVGRPDVLQRGLPEGSEFAIRRTGQAAHRRHQKANGTPDCPKLTCACSPCLSSWLWRWEEAVAPATGWAPPTGS